MKLLMCLVNGLYLAQIGRKHEQAKPLKGFGSAGVLEIVEDWEGSSYRAIYTVRFADAVFVLHVFQKKSKRGISTPKADFGLDSGEVENGRAGREGVGTMKTRRSATRISIEAGSGNVYADLGYAGSEAMLVKAKLVTKIGDIIRQRGLTQEQAAKLLGLTQPRVSGLLRGGFRGISEQRLLECLTRLGKDVQIVIRTAERQRNGRMTVRFA